MILTHSPVREFEELTSIHKEADFRLVLHAHHPLEPESATMIQSNSGDVDTFCHGVIFFF